MKPKRHERKADSLADLGTLVQSREPEQQMSEQGRGEPERGVELGSPEPRLPILVHLPTDQDPQVDDLVFEIPESGLILNEAARAEPPDPPEAGLVPMEEAVEVNEQGSPDKEAGIPTTEILAEVAEVRQQIAALESASPRKVKSGSKPRPNVVYTLLKRPAKWSGAPQVAQLLDAVFDPAVAEKYRKDGVVSIPEPDLFAIVESAAALGKLRTRQVPVRIFQYYRSDLIAADVIRQR